MFRPTKTTNKNQSRQAFLPIALTFLFLTSISSAAAVPSLEEVYRTARAGDLQRADGMMREVLQAHPESARAHYVYAQILSAEGRFADARSQLQNAQRIAPGLPFVNPRSVASLEHRLRMSQQPAP